jgi:hypothetical protein
MLPSSLERVNDLPSDALVLDVGGWAKPLPRADWVIDLLPYETRGPYGTLAGGPERFSPATWIERDICDREPWPFADGQFDFAVCSHTLEDVRDPVGVCAELRRVARAGYIEVPSRAAEQSLRMQGRCVGWSHHRWLVDVHEDRIDFVLKPHVIHGRPEYQLPEGFAGSLPPEQQVQTLWWDGSLECRERVFVGAGSMRDYLLAPVVAHAREAERTSGANGRVRRAAAGVARRLGLGPARS